MHALAAACAARWGLALEEAFPSESALVIPAGDVVLKVNAAGHFEADHEADALALWGGRGAVRLVARDDARRALLVERCRPGTPLRGAGADPVTVVCGLLSRLRARPHGAHPFRRLADEADRWADAVPARWERGGRPFERRLVDAALDVFGSVDRGACSLVNQDLHAGNVLAAAREPWLVIDPKPLVGERELDGVGLLRNAAFESPVAVRRWLDALAELGLDRERLRAWGAAHALAWAWEARTGWDARQVEAARTILAA